MSLNIEIQHTFLPSSNTDLDWIHIIIPGKELCAQAQEFVSSWYKNGSFLPPNLGSLLPYLLISQYHHKFQILISYVEPHTPISLINDVSNNKNIELNSFPNNYFGKLRATFLICSHIKPIRKLIYLIKKHRKRSVTGKFPPVNELQHGWLVGKNSLLHPTIKECNPDNYLVIDVYSQKFLNFLNPEIEVKMIGDILFSTQLLHEFRHNSTLDTPSDKNSHNLLVCFSERDIQLGYASKDYVLIDNKPIPREVIAYYEFLQARYKTVNLRLRSKPHQSLDSLSDKNFPQINTQRAISSDILWSDSVVSALSTVSISSSFLKIPSFFYISKGGTVHTSLVKQYFSQVMHLRVLQTQKALFLKYAERYSAWLQAPSSGRKEICLIYSRQTTANFYNYADSLLK